MLCDNLKDQILTKIADDFYQSQVFQKIFPTPSNPLEIPDPIDQQNFQTFSGLSGTSLCLFIGNYFLQHQKNTNKSIFLITEETFGQDLAEQVKLFFPTIPCYFYPSLSELPGNLTPISKEEIHQRILLKSQLQQQPLLVVTSLQAVLEKNRIEDKKEKIVIKSGNNYSMQEIVKQLEKMGYLRNHQVELCGQYAMKSAILDIFSPNYAHPLRLYFWDDEIETIKHFAVSHQNTLDGQGLAAVEIVIPREWFFMDNHKNLGEKIFMEWEGEQEEEKLMQKWISLENDFSWQLLKPVLDYNEFSWQSLLDFVAPENLEIFNTINLSQSYEKFTQTYQNTYKIKTSETNASLYASPQERFFPLEKLTDHYVKKIHAWETGGINSIHFSIKTPLNFKKNIEKSKNYFKENLEKNKKVFLFTSNLISAQKLSEFFSDLPHQIITPDLDTSTKITSSFLIICSPLLNGLDFENYLLINDFELFQKKRKPFMVRNKSISEVMENFTDLRENDYVVHINHGIGKYLGLERIKQLGNEKDYLKILYQDGGKLFVPVEQMNLVQRYIGSKGNAPRLDALGGKSWEKIKNRVRQQVEDMSKELISLYQQRRDLKKVPCVSDDYFQDLFEAAFPYEETEDQLRSSEEIKRDLEKNYPMERLLCGDVGFGKTEVAMRAIFKAVLSGRQVAVLVPTTILSMQHYYRFLERFKDFAVTIKVLNRFKDSQEVKTILQEVAEGKIEVLIGTHKILSQKVTFKKLGLLVIDEEQKFGVKQKEKIKKNYPQVDTLSLSATPIPRTLHMSLSSIRAISILNTPPQNRLAIKTFVLEWDESTIKDAVTHEIERGGQIFFVHDKVSSLASLATILQKLLPQVRIRIAHGQMTGHDLEKVMDAFVNHEFDMLVSTSIIESGMDIRRVNTLIVNNADHFGLTQLYQLKGRVGRSHSQAYAYFLLPSNQSITEYAMKRLNALTEHTELGAGFKISMSDLEIRGPGSILGAEQSGNIMAVGFELYTKLLNEAVENIEHKEKNYFTGSLLEIKYDGYISHKYIQEDRQKIEVYKKIANIETEEKMIEVRKEIEERFGSIIEVIEKLFKIAEIRILANSMKILSIIEKVNSIEITLFEQSQVNAQHLIENIQKKVLTISPDDPQQFSFSIFNLDEEKKFTFHQKIDKLKKILFSINLEDVKN